MNNKRTVILVAGLVLALIFGFQFLTHISQADAVAVATKHVTTHIGPAEDFNFEPDYQSYGWDIEVTPTKAAVHKYPPSWFPISISVDNDGTTRSAI